jgi:hypothetical protein
MTNTSLGPSPNTGKKAVALEASEHLLGGSLEHKDDQWGTPCFKLRGKDCCAMA